MGSKTPVVWGVLWVALSACATTRAVGFVEPVTAGRPGVRVVTMEGETWRLGLHGSAAPLAWLDGHLIDVTGPVVLGRLHVREWLVLEGRHGLPTWVGELEARGVQIGMHDHNSGAWYTFDAEGAEVVRPFLGQPVLVEGYVEGGHRVRIVFFRVLTEDG